MFSQLSRWEGVQFYLLDNLLGWGEEKNLKKKKNPFCSLFISALNNNGMNNHKFIMKLEVR